MEVLRAILYLGLLNLACSTKPYNVLLFPLYVGPRRTFYDTIHTHLNLAEHTVTFLVHQHDLSISDVAERPSGDTVFIQGQGKDDNIYPAEWERSALEKWTPDTAAIPLDYLRTLYTRCDDLLKDKDLIVHLENKKFDIIVMDLLGNDICGLVLARQLGVPVIGVTSSRLTEPISYFTFNPYFPSYLPTSTSQYGVISTVMSWTKRAKNFYSYINILKFWKNCYFSSYEEIACKHLSECLYVYDLYDDLAVVFVNSDVVVDDARPLMPNVVSIGGLTTQVPQLFPKDLEATARFYKAGIILVTLETSLAIEQFPKHILQTFVDSLSKLPHAIFWKAKNGTLENPPSNFFLHEKFNVQDILGHTRTRFIITFCHTDTVISAVFHNVPILCLPLLEEHLTMSRIVESHGIGRRLTLDQLSPETLSEEIQQMISNKSYQENVRQHSNWLRDQPSTPSDRLIYWIEYVVRHKGAPHFKTPASKLSFVQYFLLDILLIPFILLLIVIVAVKVACMLIHCSIPTTACKPKKD